MEYFSPDWGFSESLDPGYANSADIVFFFFFFFFNTWHVVSDSSPDKTFSIPTRGTVKYRHHIDMIMMYHTSTRTFMVTQGLMPTHMASSSTLKRRQCKELQSVKELVSKGRPSAQK